MKKMRLTVWIWIVIGLITISAIIYAINANIFDTFILDCCTKEQIKNQTAFCSSDSDCVPSACCHADKCVNKALTPNCAGMMCTQVCSGPLDCGAGSCKCVNNLCEVVSTESKIGMANPASVYCVEHGGKLKIMTDTTGGQYGICILADGRECEEWDYFEGKC